MAINDDITLEGHQPEVRIAGAINSNLPIIAGSSAKTGKNKFSGYTQFDYRPTGGGTNSYAMQLRHNVGSTSGSIISFDQESHIVATGTASLRGTQGVAVVDSTYTVTGGTLIGTYGQARADGTVAGSSFMAGVYGLIEEGGGAITASHVTSGWFDSHRNTAVTGNHELLYLTNNGSATMDSVAYVYGGDKITNFVTFDTVNGMVADATGESMTITHKIKIVIDGQTYYLQAGTMA